jgi:hypothetical protein
VLTVAGKWANEDLIDRDTADTLQLPSDIKPGTYILRTELLALHGNSMSYMPTEGTGPQFYIHCFNLDISGTGTAEPKGVKFPGGYKRTDPGVKFNLYRGGQSARDNYVSSSTILYAGETVKGVPHDAHVLIVGQRTCFTIYLTVLVNCGTEVRRRILINT